MPHNHRLIWHLNFLKRDFFFSPFTGDMNRCSKEGSTKVLYIFSFHIILLMGLFSPISSASIQIQPEFCHLCFPFFFLSLSLFEVLRSIGLYQMVVFLPWAG